MVYQFHRPEGNETSVKICKITTGFTDKKMASCGIQGLFPVACKTDPAPATARPVYI
jgi:hypothetical protein